MKLSKKGLKVFSVMKAILWGCKLRACISVLLMLLVWGCVGPLKTLYDANERYLITTEDSIPKISIKVEGFNPKLRNDTDYNTQVMVFVVPDSGISFSDITVAVDGIEGFKFSSATGFLNSIGVKYVVVEKSEYRQPDDSGALLKRLSRPFSRLVIVCDHALLSPNVIHVNGRVSEGDSINRRYRVDSRFRYKTHYLPFFEN